MRNFFSNKKMIVLMVALLASFGFLFTSVAVRNNKSAPPLIQQIGNDVVSIGGRIIAFPGQAIKAGLDNINDLINTYNENKALKSQIEELAQTQVRNQTLQHENESLKKQLELEATLTDYDTVTASVILRSPNDWRNIVVINKGSGAGLRKNMPVLAGKGLVGRIVEVDQTSAKVEMISTDNQSASLFAASIQIGDKTVSGVITGYDAKRGQLVMGQLSTNQEIKKGQRVMTSGLGGSTPRGLFIGTVDSVEKDEYGLADTVYLTPAADLDDISVVTVVERRIGGAD